MNYMKKLVFSSIALLPLCLTSFAYTSTNVTGSVKLQWDYPSGTAGITTFNIYLSTNSFYNGNVPLTEAPPGTQSVSVGPTIQTYTLIGLPGGRTYYIVVTATSQAGYESMPSNQYTNAVPVNPVPSPVNLRQMP